MKIQDLAIILIIIIIPISLVLSVYTQFQMKTINMQSLYDSKLTSATYDAIKAFQLNSINSSTSDIANSKLRDLEASITTFRNSLKSAFELNGYTEEELNNYIPALVYTLYDGLYIYSPYQNTNHRYETDEGNVVTDPLMNTQPKVDKNGEKLYGLKPYINYSCRYQKEGTDIDVVITYTLDNYITVQGIINGGEYVNKSGYLIDNINVNGNSVTYNGITIEKEHLRENIGEELYSYARWNGVKYYFLEESERIISFINGIPVEKEKDSQYVFLKNLILNNDSAQQYYKEAYNFTKWFKEETDLDELKYSDAYDEIVDSKGNIQIRKLWDGDNRKIFEFNSGNNAKDNIENQKSNFNQHRLAVIRQKIETNLAIAISNYNSHSVAKNEFQMPELKEDEWDYLINNISVISFLQCLPIGGKIYNGYTIVTNSESKEVVLEENIYILGSDGTYHKIGDKALESGGTVKIDDGNYGVYHGSTDSRSAGRINLDFKRTSTIDNDGISKYYYPLKDYNASYDSIVMQNNITTYDDIYEYVNEQNIELKEAFYTALGRERIGKYNINNVITDAETLKEYTVTYNTNGGIGTITSQTGNVGQNVILVDGKNLSAPSGKHFKGWCLDSNGTGTIYNSSSTQSFDEDVTLYAIWEGHTTECYKEHVHTNSCYSNCNNCGEMAYRHDTWGCDNFEAELECNETRKLICGGTE